MLDALLAAISELPAADAERVRGLVAEAYGRQCWLCLELARVAEGRRLRSFITGSGEIDQAQLVQDALSRSARIYLVPRWLQAKLLSA